MKILMFAPYCYPVPGGQESHVYELMKSLNKKGIETGILTRYEFAKHKHDTALFYMKSLFKLKTDADIIHGHDIHVGAVLMLYKYFSRIPTVLTVHSSIFLETYKKYPWLYRNMFRKQNGIVTVSEEIRDVCQVLTDKNVYYFSNGVDTDKFKPDKSDFMKKKYNLPEDAKVIITTRRLDRKNNVIELAKAFDKISEKRKDLFLAIVGDGEQRKMIEALNNKKIIITGFVQNSEIPKYLNSADVFAIPSLYEATSISCLEAMSCELPVIGTNIGGLPELIKENGILCEPKAESLAKAIEKMLDSNLGKMGKSSRKIVLEKYSWDMIVENYIKLYRSILKQV